MSHCTVAHATLGTAAIFMHYTHSTSPIADYNLGMLKV